MGIYSNTLRIVIVMAIAGSAVNLALKWGKRRTLSRGKPLQNLEFRAFTFWEFIIGMTPAAVVFAGLLGFVPIVAFMGKGTLRISNSLFYLGIITLFSLLVPLLVARLCGKSFFDDYLRQGEARGGIDLRASTEFVVAVASTFLLSAAVFYAIDHFQWITMT